MSKPADLCQYDLPNGKLCRQIALRDAQVCRHHMRLFRHGEAQMIHDEAMERLASGLERLPLHRVLRVLETYLKQARRAVRGLPEAQVTLDIALRRLAEENASPSANNRDNGDNRFDIAPNARFDHAAAARNLLQTLTQSMSYTGNSAGVPPETPVKSMTYPTQASQKTPQNQ
jgi:hypothetical protein